MSFDELLDRFWMYDFEVTRYDWLLILKNYRTKEGVVFHNSTPNDIQEFIDKCDTLATILDIEKKTLSPKKEERVNSFINKYKEEFNKAAKDNNITTYDDINSIPSEQRNTRDTRNNEILASMIKILSDLSSLEENLSRSNFEDIINARDAAIDKNIAKRRKARSPYNFLDQADYQEDVMSGAKLKAFSVTRDTFCSICNTVRPRLFKSHQVKVVYKAEDGYTLKNLKKSFENVEEIVGRTVLQIEQKVSRVTLNALSLAPLITSS